MYTPEQMLADTHILCDAHAPLTEKVEASKRLFAHAATLKAAQGGVTEATLREVLDSLIEFAYEDGAADVPAKSSDVLRARDEVIAMFAALSAQQGQGEACGYRAKNNPDCFMGPAAVAAQKAMGWDVSTDPAWVPVYTAPPAQPAERVPEGEVRLWDTQWLNIVNHDNCYRDWDKAEAINHAVKMTEQAIARNVADGKLPKARAASPAPSPARGDGGEG